MVRSSLLHLSIRTYPIRQFSLRVFSRRTVLSHTSALDDSCIDWSDSPSTEDLDNRSLSAARSSCFSGFLTAFPVPYYDALRDAAE
jgi:hypothetical protein